MPSKAVSPNLISPLTKIDTDQNSKSVLGSKPGYPWIVIKPSFQKFSSKILWQMLDIRIRFWYRKTCKELDTTVRYWEREIMG